MEMERMEDVVDEEKRCVVYGSFLFAERGGWLVGRGGPVYEDK